MIGTSSQVPNDLITLPVANRPVEAGFFVLVTPCVLRLAAAAGRRVAGKIKPDLAYVFDADGRAIARNAPALEVPSISHA
jgi:hypothetical protein